MMEEPGGFGPVIQVCGSSGAGRISSARISAGSIDEKCQFDPASACAIPEAGTDLTGNALQRPAWPQTHRMPAVCAEVLQEPACAQIDMTGNG